MIRFTLLLFFSLSSAMLHAQMPGPSIDIDGTFQRINASEFILELHLTIEEDYGIFAENIPPETAYPLLFNIKDKNVKILAITYDGKIEHSIVDDGMFAEIGEGSFGLPIPGYKNEVIISATIEVPEETKFIETNLEYMFGQDRVIWPPEEQCFIFRIKEDCYTMFIRPNCEII